MKNKIRSLFIGLALQAGVHPVPAQPALAVVPTNSQVILSWPIPGGGTNGVLLGATGLVSPNWVPATDAFPVNYGSQIAVSVTNVPAARFFRLSLVPPAADGMALIPAGPFTMGDSLDGASTAIPTTIYVSAFYMDTNLVSYSQWQSVYAWALPDSYAFRSAGSGKAANHPVQKVDWFDCVKWCNARSEQAGLTPAYYTDAALTQVYRNGEMGVIVYANWPANGYRLPTEAEWEKAARGGLTGRRFPWGDTISESQANYDSDLGNSYDLGPHGFNATFATAMPYTSPVGYFAANGYGLYDMAGNVSEQVWDWYGNPYGQPTTTNPTGPAFGDYRILRGGNWAGYSDAASCAGRDVTSPTNVFSLGNVGFRCVRGL